MLIAVYYFIVGNNYCVERYVWQLCRLDVRLSWLVRDMNSVGKGIMRFVISPVEGVIAHRLCQEKK